jgi:hypothetical protein
VCTSGLMLRFIGVKGARRCGVSALGVQRAM